MKKISSLGIVLLGLTLRLVGVETQGLISIGHITGVQPVEHGLKITCDDGATVQLSFLAEDLVRVFTVFPNQTADPNHSWAVDRAEWATVATKFTEDAASVRLMSDKLEVRINKDPLLISFVDRQTGRVVNADQRPMARDPKTERIAIFKRLGLAEHFYGLGERAAHLDRRRSEFMMWNSDTPGYVEGTDPLYQSIPFYLGLDQGRAYGLFYDNSFKSTFDFGRPFPSQHPRPLRRPYRAYADAATLGSGPPAESLQLLSGYHGRRNCRHLPCA
jgi:alpha-glucosidase